MKLIYNVFTAPSPSYMPTFSDLHTSSRHFVGGMPNHVAPSQGGSSAPNEFGSFNYHRKSQIKNARDDMCSRSAYPSAAYRSHGHVRSPSSPGPGTPTSHPGSISPPFSAADTSPPTSISAGSRRPHTGNGAHMEGGKYWAPTSLVLGATGGGGGGTGPGLSMVGGHPFIFGGQRSSVSFETPIKKMGITDGNGSDGDDAEELSPGRGGPRRT